ncbi:MAG: Na+/H+ antiporter NhaC family protein [Clostridiales bacterium]|nr:Na+/H+ antiporter NhaC family protein [Clostridiales bacterium]
MKNISKKRRAILAVLLIATVLIAATVFAEGEEVVSPFANSFWALVPPIVAIGLALITKEVYSSLFAGIFVGACFYANFNFEGIMNHLFVDGMIAQLSDGWNVGILIFLVMLGAVVALMNKAGGAAAFGKWSSKNIKTRTGAQLATIALGCLIFIDDYFNCLTVGSVMQPVTDKHNISRAKLSYLIDATAAPVCIIAPISSWAAAVTGFVDGYDGLSLFIDAIPYNFYALLTIAMMITIVLLKVDFGPMATHEKNAIEKGDLYTTPDRPYSESNVEEVETNAKVLDLVLPIVVLIAACVVGMIYTGGFFSGASFVEAFSGSDASVGLVFGSSIGLLFTIVYLLCRRVINFKDAMDCIPEGFKAMVPAILILTFAWTLKAMTDSLGAADYVAALVESGAAGFMNFLPAIVFIVACGLAFATGTSWGTFGILIPIVVSVFGADGSTIMIIAISACMAGAVCGDHCSPISDTTIMASAGGKCNHINHVSTQLPYALLVAGVSFVMYIVAGFVQSVIVLPIAIAVMVGVIFLIKFLTDKKAASKKA